MMEKKVHRYFEELLNKIYDNLLLSVIVATVVSLFFFLFISGHFNIYTQLVIGYGVVVLMLVAIILKVESKYFLLFLKLLGVLIVLRYLYWRTFDSLSYEGFYDFIGALLLYFAELVAIIIYLLGIFSSLRLLHRKPIDLESYPKEQWPTVDILIPTYNEPFEIVENTLLAATGMDYPKEKYQVYLLDDGGTDQKCNDPDPKKAEEARKRRKHLQGFCKRIGATYITREKNEHAKAGNLNHALKYVHGDLIVIFDTDHVPVKEFLKKSVGWFLKEEKLFLLQTPHAFYNADPIERNLRMADTALSENDMFYKFIQLGHDFWESSFFCGSAAILRRKYLDEVGGIAGDTITEDAETALELHNRGYKSAYLKEPMIRGLQPETLDAFLLQRIRWTQGMVQIFLLKNPFLAKRLRWHQKISYFSASFFWFFAFSRVVFYLAPLAYLIFGLQIYNANGIEMISYVVPHMLVAVMISYLLYARVRNPFFSELYETVLSFFTLPAILSVLKNPKAPKFKVTPKGVERLEEHVSEEVSVFVILFTLVLLGFLFAIYRWIEFPQERGVVLMTAAWNMFNFVFLVAAIGAASEKRELRRYIRVPLYTAITIDAGDRKIEGEIVDISEGGVNVVPKNISSQNEEYLAKKKRVELVIPDVDGVPFRVSAKFLRAYGWGKHLIFQFEGLEENLEIRRKLVQLIYANGTLWTEVESKKPVLNPLQSFFFIFLQGLKNAMIWEAYKVTLSKILNMVFSKEKSKTKSSETVILHLQTQDLVGEIIDFDETHLRMKFADLPEGIEKLLDKVKKIELEIGKKRDEKVVVKIIFEKFELRKSELILYYSTVALKQENYRKIAEIVVHKKDGDG